jgi:hypothetical protein
VIGAVAKLQDGWMTFMQDICATNEARRFPNNGFFVLETSAAAGSSGRGALTRNQLSWATLRRCDLPVRRADREWNKPDVRTHK